ncbi:MAG: hypothetical protein QXF59_04790 [Candidatus Bathyarchaeia archaeon]
MLLGRKSTLNLKDKSGLILDSKYLSRLRSEAIRRRVWFRALSRLERGLINLVVKVVDRARSPNLINVLAKIIVKVKRAMMSPLKQVMTQVGRPLAKKISMIALKWGNKSAAEWAEDEGFIRYLAVMDMNNTPGFKLSDTLMLK